MNEPTQEQLINFIAAAMDEARDAALKEATEE
jgi:hypothetical protein